MGKSHRVLLLLPRLLLVTLLLGLLVGRILTLFLIAVQQLDQPRALSRITAMLPLCEVKAQILNQFYALVVADVFPQFALAAALVAVARGVGFFRAASGLLSVVDVRDKVKVLASFSVGAVALAGEVDAELGSVIARDVGLEADLVVEVRKGALHR